MNTGQSESFEQELREYGEWIKKYRANQIGEIKMQKIRLQLGTYNQRQQGVYMQRIKFPGGVMTSRQLSKLADVSDQYANGFIHFTTREDGQLYYLKLEEAPDMIRELASAEITTREACGNTVRNITACYRSGMSATEPFDVTPYAEALYRYLVYNKFNQVMGRKFKIAFESCAEDHAGMRIHDFGFKAVIKKEGDVEKRGFRTYIGGGLGAVPMMGHLYTEFLPEEEMMNLAAATVRIFDRFGERKNRMIARMKYLVKKMGWEKFKEELDKERKIVKLPDSANDYLKAIHSDSSIVPKIPGNLPTNPEGLEEREDFQEWCRDSSVASKFKGFKGVNVRLKLGDIVSDKARKLADIAAVFSQGTLRITIEQNLFLPFVPEAALSALYAALSEIGLAEAGAETMADTTTCPGADTCRLGITSAKGLGSHISDALSNGLGRYKELTRNLRVKVSGCPNGCAQHGISNIGFQGAAVQKDGKPVPAHEIFIGGANDLDNAAIGERIGKVPARNGAKAVEALVELYSKEKQGEESFNACMKRLGKARLQEAISSLMEIPSFEEDPSFYKDWGHENEKFAVRTGVKGECAGAPVQEKAPVLADAKEALAQAEALLAHKEFGNARLEAYQAIGRAVRVPLYAGLVDPFTSEQAIWEFENLFARTGKIDSTWIDFSDRVEKAGLETASEQTAQIMIEYAEQAIAVCEQLIS